MFRDLPASGFDGFDTPLLAHRLVPTGRKNPVHKYEVILQAEWKPVFAKIFRAQGFTLASLNTLNCMHTAE
jgi:hypothetical protein